VCTWTSRAASALHHASAFWTASAEVLSEGLELFDLLRREDAARREHGLHALLLHLSSQGVHLIDFLHDGVVVRVVCPQQFTQFDVAQFEIRARLDGSFLGVYADLVQALHLLVSEAESLANARVLCQAKKRLALAKSTPAAALPTISPLSWPAEFPRAAAGKPVLTTPLVLGRHRTAPLRVAILSSRYHRSRQQNHQTQHSNCNSPSHNRISSCHFVWTEYVSASLPRMPANEHI
jgi:hypothetical protein